MTALRSLAPLAVVVLAALELSGFLAEGLPLFWDAHSHLARTAFAARAFGDGGLPNWSNDWYGGYRLLTFYSPGYYWVTGLLANALDDPVASTKAVLFSGQVVSVVGLQLFVGRLAGSAWIGALAAVLLLCCPARSWVLGVIGNYPSLLVYTALPWMLALVVSTCRDERSWRPLRLCAGQALLLALMLLSHSVHAALVLPPVLAFQAAWILQRRPSPEAGWRALAAAGSAVPLAGVVAAFSVAPGLVDLELASLSLDRGLPNPPGAPRSLLVLAGLAPFSFDQVFLRDHGSVWFAAGLCGALLSLRRENRAWRPVAVGLGVALACVAILGERASLGVGLFLYALCGGCVAMLGELLATRLPRSKPIAVPGLCAAAATLALATSSPSGDVRYLAPDALDVYTRLPDAAAHARTFDVTRTDLSLDGFYGASSFSPLLSDRAIPFGAYPQGAPIASQVAMALMGRVAHDLRQSPSRLSEESLDALYLWNVAMLVERNAVGSHGRLGAHLRGGQLADDGGEVFALDRVSPVVWAPRLQPLPKSFHSTDDRPALVSALRKRWLADTPGRLPSASLEALRRPGRRRDWEPLVPLLRDMEIDRESGTAARIFVDRASAGVGKRAVGDRVPGLDVLEHEESRDSVRMTLKTAAAGFLRLSYVFDPDLRIRLDGEEIRALPDSLGGAIVLEIPAGTHVVEVRPPESRHRTLLVGVSAVTAFGLLLVALRPSSPSS